jgi:WD40 repeat protein
MKNKDLFILFLLLFFIACETKSDSTGKSYLNVTELNPSNRIFKEYISEKYYSNISLYEPGYFSINQDSLFIADLKTLKIYTGLIDNNFELKYLTGNKGRGPSEFERISGLIMHNGKLYVGDENLGRISIFDSKGLYENSIDVSRFGVYRFTISQDNIVLLSPLRQKHAIKVIDLNTGELKLNMLLRDLDLSPLIYTGSITSDSDGKVLFGGFSEPVLIVYDLNEDGEIVYSVDLVSSYSSASNYIQFNPNGDSRAFRYAPTAEFYINAIALFNSDIYILTKVLNEKFIDVYDLVLGEYKYSLKVDESAVDITTNNKGIFILNNSLPTTSLTKIIR